MASNPRKNSILWGLIIVLLLLAACQEDSGYGANEQTQVAVYLTQIVPTVQAGGIIGVPEPNVVSGPAPAAGPVGALPTQPPRAATEEDVLVSRVVDGDTIELVDGRSVRLIGINTPEDGQPLFVEASRFIEGLVGGQTVSLAYDLERNDQFGRTLAYVYVGDIFVNLEIIRAGYANVLTVAPNTTYQQAFTDGQLDARNQGRGVWARSNATLNITALNPAGEEWVEVTNEGGQAINLVGFTLKDEANHLYTFPDISLPPAATLRLYSTVGFNEGLNLYWSQPEPVWNDDGDTAFLRDTIGALVDEFSY